MKKTLLSIILLFCAAFGYSQDLINSRVSSYYTFIYKITNDEAEKLYRSKDTPVNTSFFHSLIDQFPSDSIYKKILPFGHYLYVSAVEEKLTIEMESRNNLEMTILNNNRDLLLLFLNTQGAEIEDLEPKFGIRRVPLDRELNAFRLSKTNKKGWIHVLHQGHVNYFNVKRQYNNTLPARTKRRLLGTFPLNHLLSPVFYITRSVKRLIAYGNISPPGIYYRAKKLFTDKSYNGYVALNKPKFKPGDTVQLKAFITTKKGRPIKKELILELSGYTTAYFRKNLGTLASYRPGAYTFEFVLHDSLKLILDKQYHINILNKNFNSVLSKSFYFEQYDLKSNTFTLSESPGNISGHPANILLSGTDSNELPLYDIDVTILVKSSNVSQYYNKLTFVPDTLWSHHLKLDPLGDTKLSLPDSIFPNASLEYNVEATFTNTENERHTKTLTLSYDARAYAVEYELVSDSLHFREKSSSHPYVMKYLDSRLNVLDSKLIELPFKEKINQQTHTYQLWHETKLAKQITMADEDDGIDVMAQRTQDSLTLFVQNSRKLLFRYQLFRNNIIVESGNAQEYHCKKATKANDTYYFALQYIWCDLPQEQNFDLPFAKKPLTIVMDHPTTVYPGQTVDINLNVKDAFGSPVEDVDLTAYATTKKFRNTNHPVVPQYEKHKSRKVFNIFRQKDAAEETTQHLEYNFWRSKLGLDSIAYYNFLYPGKVFFMHYTTAEDSITQVAPYVVQHGVVQKIHYIYINNRLAYLSNTQGIVPYSFKSDTGTVDITVRLSDKLLFFSDLIVQPGQKLIFSVDLDSLPDDIHSVKRENVFSTAEAAKLTPHFIQVNRTSEQSTAYFKQGDSFYFLRLLQQRQSSLDLAGPFFPGSISYHSNFAVDFYYKPERSYTFQPNLIDRESFNPNFGKRYLFNERIKTRLKDQVLTEQRVSQYLKDLEKKEIASFRAYPENYPLAGAKGSIQLTKIPAYSAVPLAIFILNLDQPDQYFLHPGRSMFFNNLSAGNYQLVVIYNDETYLRIDPVTIKPYGRTFIDLHDEQILPPDAFSREVFKKVKTWATERSYVDFARQQDIQKIRQLYYEENTASSDLTNGHWITGYVIDDADLPIPGVNIIVKGTTIGTTTDIDGAYRIYAPHNAVLVVSFVGYATQEIAVLKPKNDIKLEADIQALSEVVVVGYGVQRKMNMTSSVSTLLEGKMAGVSIDGSIPGASDSLTIRIRGASSLNNSNKPLVIIDGVLVRWEDVDKNKIKSIEILKPTDATAIYGSRAAEGVILISTKPGITRSQLLQTKIPAVQPSVSLHESLGNSLRKNFRDYAFWNPSLRTDKNGNSKFKVTFPDDITAWDFQVLAMGTHKRTGQSSGVIQSFKPLAAQIATPQFLIHGDSSYAIGKITNYTADSVSLKITNTMNGKVVIEKAIKIKNSFIDSILMVGLNDSLTVKYVLTKEQYEDGEERKIPVLPVGAKESKGIFVIMPKDTMFTLPFDNTKGKIKIYAQADMLDVLWDELQVLKMYPYECNEQLASKLKAFLAEKVIAAYKREKFEHNKQVEKIIRKLTNNQSKDGGWSWWGNGESSSWISLHVAEALAWAEKLNYKVMINQSALKNHLINNFDGRSNAFVQLKTAIFLAQAKEHVMAQALVDTLARQKKLYSNYYKLLAQRLMQLNGNEPDWPWIEKQKNSTLKGNWYWGEEKHTLINNDIDNTLIVYQMMESRNPSDPNLFLLRNYFLEKRTRSWANTYQSSSIIEILLPSLLKQGVKGLVPQLKIEGSLSNTFKEFPVQLEIENQSSLTITKSGDAPVYFAAYQEIWNASPDKVEKDFVISTALRDSQNKWKAGKPVQLDVTIEVKKDADYVMITVPIPAGCAYGDKSISRINGEVYREYDLHETRIYCERIRAGSYLYSVSLLPRYKGKYHINPAKAEWMYFPVIFGRNEIRKISID